MNKYVVWLLLSLLPCLALSERVNDNYAAFAEQKKQEQSAMIAPYLNDVQTLKAQSMQKVQSQKIQALMASVTGSQNVRGDKGESEDQHVTGPVVVFVSFSMPPESLKLWLQQAHKAGVKVVMRGLVNNSFKQTAAAVAALVKKDAAGLQIDPTLFKRFAITKVPAVIVTDQSVCPSTVSCLPNFDVIYGNVSLDYVLEKLANADTARSPLARAKLQKIRG